MLWSEERGRLGLAHDLSASRVSTRAEEDRSSGDDPGGDRGPEDEKRHARPRELEHGARSDHGDGDADVGSSEIGRQRARTHVCA